MTHWKIKWHEGFTVKLKSLPVHTCNMTGLPDLSPQHEGVHSTLQANVSLVKNLEGKN